jgi:hypothetical protein
LPPSPRHSLRGEVNSQLLSVLGHVCKWPDGSAKTDGSLYPFWIAVLGFDPPYGEYEAWRNFFMQEFAVANAEQAVAAMSFAMMMNPFVLLR